MIQPANRVTEIQEYYFSRKLKEVAKLNAEGMDIISLAIGSPDMPPSKQTIDKLCDLTVRFFYPVNFLISKKLTASCTTCLFM